MSKNINLLLNKREYLKYENYFTWFRRGVYAFGVLILLFILIVFYKKQLIDSELSRLLRENREALEDINKNKSLKDDMDYLAVKKNAMKNFLNRDSNFYFYYNLLVDTISKATSSASLSEMQIDSDKNVKFSVLFKNYPDLYNFLSFTESDVFLNNFSNLSLMNFLATEKKNFEYELQFTGQFKKVKHEF